MAPDGTVGALVALVLVLALGWARSAAACRRRTAACRRHIEEKKGLAQAALQAEDHSRDLLERLERQTAESEVRAQELLARLDAQTLRADKAQHQLHLLVETPYRIVRQDMTLAREVLKFSVIGPEAVRDYTVKELRRNIGNAVATSVRIESFAHEDGSVTLKGRVMVAEPR